MRQGPYAHCPLAMVLMSLAGGAMAEDPDPGWVAACSVYDSERAAQAAVTALEEITLMDAGSVWIPAWPSLGGYQGWMACIGPFDTDAEAADAAFRVLWRHPDAYAIYVGHPSDRRTSSPAPSDISAFLGLVPVPAGLLRAPGIEYPAEGWLVGRSAPDIGVVQEWEQPVLIRASRGDWRIEIWQDCYAGATELRARFRPEDPSSLDEWLDGSSRLMARHAEPLGLELISRDGIFALLREPSDPSRRLSNRDFWVYRLEDSIQIGYTVRDFYGEPLYCWDCLPERSHANPFPPSEGLEHAFARLAGLVSSEGLYPWAGTDGISFAVQFMDGLEPSAPREYVDLVVRERHTPESGGDPLTAPVVDRFRVNVYTSEILWYEPLTGSYTSLDELLERRP